jgi:hypothetical protein
VECEKWRRDFKLDELVRTFDYTEKADVFKYYPQYYHKTDKVEYPPDKSESSLADEKTLGWETRIH